LLTEISWEIFSLLLVLNLLFLEKLYAIIMMLYCHLKVEIYPFLNYDSQKAGFRLKNL